MFKRNFYFVKPGESKSHPGGIGFFTGGAKSNHLKYTVLLVAFIDKRDRITSGSKTGQVNLIKWTRYMVLLIAIFTG
jgi:hypothetical protein